MSHKRLKLFLIEMALTWIGQKYKTQLVSGFKLPNLKYKGPSVRRHYIRASPKLLVTELPDLQPSFPLLACSTFENSGKNQLANVASELSSRAAGVTEFFTLPPDIFDQEVSSTCIPQCEPSSLSSLSSRTPSPHSISLLQSPDALFCTYLQSSSLPGTVGISKEEEPSSFSCCTSSLKSCDGTENNGWLSTSATLADLPSLFVDGPPASSVDNPYKPANIAGEPNLVNNCKGNTISKFGPSCSKEMSKDNAETLTSVTDEPLEILSCYNEENDDQQMPKASFDIQMRGPTAKMEYRGYPVDEIAIYVYLAPWSNFEGLSACATISKIFLEGNIPNGLEIPLLFCTSLSRVNVVLNECEATLMLKLPVIPYHIAYFDEIRRLEEKERGHE